MTESTAKARYDQKPSPVLVIGAGPAGLVTGYFLQQAGIEYEIIDQATVIASTWASLYPSLRLNTTRYFSHMPGRKFPLGYGVFPTGRQYHAYVEDFARQHGLRVSLGIKVTRVAPESGGWRVESSRGTTWHPVVVLATGRFSNPVVAHIPQIEQFSGTVIHAHDYHGADPFSGKRVLIVGNGPSGLDIALEIGHRNGPAIPALLSMRTGITLRRRYPLGMSKHAWVIATRWIPSRLREPFLEFVEKMGFSKASMRGIKTPPQGVASGAVAVRGGELIQAVRRGEVICVDAPKQIDKQSVTLMDGTRREIDSIILATGYRPALEYLDSSITFDCDEQGWPLRYNSRPYRIDYKRLRYKGTYDSGPKVEGQFKPTLREVEGEPGLFQVGLYYKGKGAMYNFNVEAEIAAAQIGQYLSFAYNQNIPDT